MGRPYGGVGSKAMQLAQWIMAIELVTMAMQINGLKERWNRSKHAQC